MMDPNTYQQRALRTMADQDKILHRLHFLGPKAMQLLNGLIGLQDEVGEIASNIKKYVEYGQPLDRLNLQEEVGDACWRLGQICDAAGLTLGGCMAANEGKLKIRYPDKFTEERAAESGRDRAAEREIIESAGDVPVKMVHPYCGGCGHNYFQSPKITEQAAEERAKTLRCVYCVEESK